MSNVRDKNYVIWAIKGKGAMVTTFKYVSLANCGLLTL
jgi:hypothetical protein